ncbi:hypothetical protein [Bacillus mesophilum]|uniref:YhjD n=1 Tax=Bacillus mesophilum TaxID=1071718 RepID=A0A7V7RPE2_9BACI|nr:hypothetical protein [Bacillus mesophilum]KAB2335103.1 hypothetical protein F7732_00575 [Bacillus mesophilum]
MTRIPEEDRDLIEKAMYLPMVVVILEKDFKVIEKAPFKLRQPYLDLVDETLRAVQRDLKGVKDQMRKKQMKVQQTSHDESFTQFSFIWKGYEEKHNYFNPAIRNRVEALLNYYLKKIKTPLT